MAHKFEVVEYSGFLKEMVGTTLDEKVEEESESDEESDSEEEEGKVADAVASEVMEVD